MDLLALIRSLMGSNCTVISCYQLVEQFCQEASSFDFFFKCFVTRLSEPEANLFLNESIVISSQQDITIVS